MRVFTHLVCFFYEIAEILHIQVNLNKKDSTYWHWYIYAVFFVNEKSIYWLLVFKIFGLKIWTCNFFWQISCLYFPKAKLLQVPSAVQGCAREHRTFAKERLRRAFNVQPIDEYSLGMAESIFRWGTITGKRHFFWTSTNRNLPCKCKRHFHVCLNLLSEWLSFF